jgi:hypothetical protein
VDVTGGKSKKRYTMVVGDRGRSFKNEAGEEIDEPTFKEREGDYTTAGGSENVIKAGGYRYGPQAAERKVMGAPTMAKEGPSLGDAAAALARRKKAEGQ